MRPDMGKVITERPRAGSHWRCRKHGTSVRWTGADADYDDQPKRVSASAGRQYGWEARYFTDVLGPIYRFLDKQVGRPWDKVHSELCASLDKRKLTHAHVFSHIDGYVELHPFQDERGIWRHRRGQAIRHLYRDPRTGLVCRPRWKRRSPPAPAPVTRIDIGPLERFERIAGIWYRCTYFKVPQDPKPHLALKRQLGKKELRRLRELHGVS